MRCDDCLAQLDALHDSELMPVEETALRAHLSDCPDCARAYDILARTSHLLQEGLVHYSAPDVLKARIHGALMRERDAEPPVRAVAPWNRWSRLAAAGLAVALASSAATFAAMRQSTAARSAADQVLASHVRSLMPNHLIDVASNDQHNVKPWFNGRVDLSPQVPALDSSGFVLAGGRLDYLAGRPVAVVVYTRRQHVINVYSWPEAGSDTPEVTTTAQGYHLMRWSKGGVAYWVVSDLNAGELSQFVTLYQGRGLEQR
ncbi:MAG: putative transrane anti-sigma factor [Gemmatimonadetes bacterium]|nr:putative transrane anti-sigma factor [Gemmatimonadota bacterium]